ncbi:hypothetical protein DSO57_1033031 [Entomophthora muscae]|uniref:Uncharacterized protein n=1 Tax=Entomophthora muscae TaxID=34485 RepID=A0ACC2TAZ2_9FUNG|nr:hypothetical protein DSO57_1033031 [Entomophthora muscae]
MSQQGDPKSDSDDRYASDSQEDIASEETFHDTDDLGFENDEELGETHENLSTESLGRFRTDPVGYMMRLTAESSAFIQGLGWRNYDNYLGARIFESGATEDIKNVVLGRERIKSCIDRLMKELDTSSLSAKEAKRITRLPNAARAAELDVQLRSRSRSILDRLSANMNSLPFIKLFAFTLNTILVRMYHQGIYIKESEFAKVREAAKLASERGVPLIVLPCHKSHVDYLVISYVFFRLGLALPFIAAGDNLDLPVVGSILRKGGAFFIRRSWADDPLYEALAREYIQVLMERGYNIECFIEGTRSRTGKLLNPKFGILRIILDAVISGRVKDALVVPISIGYDRVVETSSYVNELLGTPKERESLWGIFTNTRIFQLRWGRIDIRFAKPFFLREYLDQQIEKRNFTQDNVDQKIILQALGYRVMSDINSASVVMPTALVGTVLLTLRGRGVGQDELVRRVGWLKRHILLKGGKVAHFGGMGLREIVTRATTIIKDLIGTRPELIEPVYFAINRFELSYYRNQVIHIFLSEALVSVSLYTIIKRGGSRLDQRFPFKLLLEEVVFLSQLLKWDFVYPPGKAEDNLRQTLEFLVNSKVLTFNGEFIELSEAERASGRENYDFYCFLLWPFVESYWLASVSLFSLGLDECSSEPAWIEEPAYVNKVQQLGKTLYYQGDLSYLEAINKETMANAFMCLKEMGIILSRPSPRPARIALNPTYLPQRDMTGAILPQGLLWTFVERIGSFRREGKNRRDNATGNLFSFL